MHDHNVLRGLRVRFVCLGVIAAGLLGNGCTTKPPPAPAASGHARATTAPPVPPMPVPPASFHMPAPTVAPVGVASAPVPAPAPAVPAVHAMAAPPTGPAPIDSTAWDAVMKEQETKAGATSADFFFSVTNISSSNVVIDHVTTSCHCTVGKLPSQPWVLKPQEDGKINVSVDLRGKTGTFFKTVSVFFTNGPAKQLTVKVTIPDNPETIRARNMQLATVDRQAVFKGDCASCHLEPTRGKTGKDLYVAACGVCHEAEKRATMVPNLHALNHSTDRIYWKQWIETGKDATLMPGWGAEKGGPLNEAQIDSLVEYLDKTIPHDPPASAGASISNQ